MRQKGLNTMIKISLLSVMAFILMFLEVPLPIFPSFLKIDLSDLPALFGAFALGPAAGIGIELLKNILHIVFKGTQTGFVGEFANFAVGATLAVTAGTIYRVNKSKKTAILGLVVGSIVMSLVASVLNYTVLLPLYAKVYKAPIDAFVAMGAAVNPNIKTVKDLVMWSIFPFNLLKGIVVSAVTVPLYKRVSPMLHNEVVKDNRRIA
ncbi:ECF transporter S component [Clostridium sp.]|jgi:riboflavin transporter FmnP|uniref:ECF transporter S component n=1 Tax=Clostridium sp. TaxID=1506 RepID=UPI0039F559AF